MTGSPVDVTVVLPIFNEAEALPYVLPGIRLAMERTARTYEILVSDDCSADQSVEIAKRAGCRVIQSSVRSGAGAARKAGILAAHGDIIVMLDADGTYASSDIPEMLRYFPEYDQVNGARTNEAGEYPVLRGFVKWLIRMMAILLTGRKTPDLNTGLKAFRRDTMFQYLWAIPDGFSCVSSMTIAYLCDGRKVKYIPTTCSKRIGRSKFHPIVDTLSYIVTVFRLATFFAPWRLFLSFSFFFIGMGVCMILQKLLGNAHGLDGMGAAFVLCGLAVSASGFLLKKLVSRWRSATSVPNGSR